jgi:hypothetical protein
MKKKKAATKLLKKTLKRNKHLKRYCEPIRKAPKLAGAEYRLFISFRNFSACLLDYMQLKMQ